MKTQGTRRGRIIDASLTQKIHRSVRTYTHSRPYIKAILYSLVWRIKGKGNELQH